MRRTNATFMLLLGVIILLSAGSQASSATPIDYYVSADHGNDFYDGRSVDTPFRTLQKAHNVTAPGDTVHIMEGTYFGRRTPLLRISRSGQPGAYITYKAYEDHKPVLTVDRAWEHVVIEGASYIVIEGLEVAGIAQEYTQEEAEEVYEYFREIHQTNQWSSVNWGYLATTSTAGIFVKENPGTKQIPHHIIIRNNLVHHVPGGGIGASRVDYITIENNVVHNSAWYSPYATSGISIYQPQDIDDNTEDYKIIIRGNLSHSNRTKVKWAVSGDYSDGNGIIIDDAHGYQSSDWGRYHGRMLVENNIVYNNGGSGIHVYASDNVDIINNTAYQNSVNPALNYGAIFANTASNVRIMNNIAHGDGTDRANEDWRNQNVVYDNNIWYNFRTVRVQGETDRIIDPMFVNAQEKDFRLHEDSPARGSANPDLAPETDFFGNPRPRTGFDVGAILPRRLGDE